MRRSAFAKGDIFMDSQSSKLILFERELGVSLLLSYDEA